MLVEYVILVDVNLLLSLEHNLLDSGVTVIDELVDLEDRHALVLLLLLDDGGDLGEELLELEGVYFLVIVVDFIQDLVGNLLLLLFIVAASIFIVILLDLG